MLYHDRMIKTCWNSLVTGLIMPSSLLQVVNCLFQTCYNKPGTSSANTTCWQLVNRLVTTCLQTCVFTCVLVRPIVWDYKKISDAQKILWTGHFPLIFSYQSWIRGSTDFPLSGINCNTIFPCFRHAVAVMNSPGWITLVNNHSHLLAEAFKELATQQGPFMNGPPKKRLKTA